MPFKTYGPWLNLGKIELIKAYRSAYASSLYKGATDFTNFSQMFDKLYGGDIQAFGFYINDKNGWTNETGYEHIASLRHTKDWVEANYEFASFGARYLTGVSPKRNPFADYHNSWALLIVKAHSL